jgi:hypothetical protein
LAIRSATAARASVNGWDANIRGDARKRGVSFDQRYDTVVQMQEKRARTWEIELPTGGYEVLIACGDAAGVMIRLYRAE